MPYNLLLLPLLGGYILVTYTNCAVYWSSRQAREQLLLASAFVGLLLAMVARPIVILALQCSWGLATAQFVHSILDLKGIGTAAVAFGLGVAGTLWLNKAWPMFESGIWLYGRGALTQLESLMMLSIYAVRPAPEARFRSMPVEILKRLAYTLPIVGKWLQAKNNDQNLWLPIVQPDADDKLSPVPILLTMKDRKVYVGLLASVPPLTAMTFTHLNLAILRSGYRDKDTLRVSFTEDYTSAFEQATTDIPPYKVIPIAEISSASLFDATVFSAFHPQEPQESDPGPVA
jgi:hypothetical protein